MLRLLPLLLVLPSLALAQTLRLRADDVPVRSLTLPPTSVATVEDAPALAINPAALTYVGSLQLHYLHERNGAQGYTGNGLYLADTFFDAIGAGVSLEWLRLSPPEGLALPDFVPDARRFTFGLSLGGESLSLGASYATYASSNRAVSGIGALSLGLSGRPIRQLAYGLVFENVDEQARGGARLDRAVLAGLGVRPFGERFTLAADYRARLDALESGRLGYTLRARVLRGITLGAGVSHGLGADTGGLQLQASLTLDSERLGVTYAAGGTNTGMDHVFGVRLSTAPWQPVRLSDGDVAMFDLDDLLAGSGGGALALLGIGGPGEDPFIRLMRLMEGARRDPMLRGVVLKVSSLPGVGLGRAEELRQSIVALRAAGKRVAAVVLSADDATYLAISAAEKIFLLPQGMLEVNGLSASVTSLGGSMEKLGVKWDAARVGEYKTAPEQLMRSEMSPAQKETIDALLKTNTQHLEATIASARKIPVEKVREGFAAGLLTPARAQSLGFIDGVLEPKALDKEVAALVPGARFNPYYRPGRERDERWGTRPKIAVIPVIGNIAGGKSREDPLGAAQIAGAETVIRAVERAVADPDVKGILIRVDSGGGDGLASDLMYRSIREAATRKPVVASMGDAAASGGYYAAMAAHEIVAAPTTITGSIGVFVLKPAVDGLARKLGVNREVIPTSPLANILSIWEPWTPEAQAAAQTWVDAFYADFIGEVAKSRNLSVEKVDAVARGRVWSGADAKERGLVDTLGGFGEALASVRKRAGISPEAEVSLVVLGDPTGFLVSPGGEPGVADALLGPVVQPKTPGVLLQLAREAGFASEVLLTPGMKAMQPFQLTIR